MADWRTQTEKWTRDAHGYAICPRCGAMVHQRCIDWHAEACGRPEARKGDDTTKGDGRE